MTPANLLMLGSGIVAFIIGGALLLRRGGSEQAVVARRIAGTMALALGLALIIFAIGLAGVGGSADA
jgi:membrane-bound ClpP family serine protease